jgi:integration host factor subunit beta
LIEFQHVNTFIIRGPHHEQTRTDPEAHRLSYDMTRNQAKTVVDLFFDSMSAALANGERVELRGLCTMYVKDYPSYTGRNPKTGEKVTVAPKKLPFFKCGKELKERVNGKK